MGSASSSRQHRKHDTATLPYTKDSRINTSTDSELCGTPRPMERTTTTTQDNLRVTYGGNEPPSNRLQAEIPQTAQHRERIAPPADSEHHATLPRYSDQPTNPTAVPDYTRALPPPSPYAPNRTTPPSGALTVCADFRALGTERVPGQPGPARPPAPQDDNPEDDTPRLRAPTPKSAQRDTPQEQPTELRATRTTCNSSPAPELAGTHLTQSPKHCNPSRP